MTLGSEATMTVASLVDETLDALHGYVRNQDLHTSLSGAVTDTALSLPVVDANQVSRGLLEVDDELMMVSTVDPASGAVMVEPWGRGHSGTTAVAHVFGARVVSTPLYPRHRVATAIYGVLREVFPDVYAAAQTTLDVNPAKTNYALPADCYHVLAVEWRLPGPTGMWVPAARWRQNKTPTTVELELLSPVFPGTGQARVRYMRVPPTQVAGTDDLATYGYSTEIRDLLVLGTTARMLAFTESSRVQVQSMESSNRSEAVPAGSAQNLSRYLYQLFQKRVEDERKQLALRYPLQPHRTR